jgi:hypothetical protein
MPLDDQTKAAFAAASDLAKQLISLSTGIVTLEVAFAGGLFKAGVPSLWQLKVSWVCLLLAIAAGIWELMAVTGTLAKAAAPASADIYKPNIAFPAVLQILAFLIGIAFTMWYGLDVLSLKK